MKLQYLFLALCLLWFVSCQTTNHGNLTIDENGTPFYDIAFQYKKKERGYVYVVNNFVVGNKKESLRNYLTHQKRGNIVFESDTKLMPETTDALIHLFLDLGFHVEQFWLPSSTVWQPNSPYPGRVNSMGSQKN